MKRKVYLIIMLAVFIICLCYVVVGVIIDNSYEENMPILAYHVISDNPSSDMEVSTKNFERQMKYLHDNGFYVMTLDEVMEFKNQKKLIAGKKVAITFDDGSESYYTKALPIMEKYHFPSTIFVITGRIDREGYLTKEEIEELQKNPLVSLESHSNNLHDHDSANSADYKLYNEDLKKNKNYEFKYYAYPFGISNDEYIKALKDNNIQLAFKYSPSHWMNIHDDDYTLPRVPVYNSTSFIKFVLKVLVKR